MEPTRTGSFDDEMYNNMYKEYQKYIKFDAGLYYVSVDKRLLTNEMWERELEQIEKQIADSHDITKSNFGYE